MKRHTHTMDNRYTARASIYIRTRPGKGLFYHKFLELFELKLSRDLNLEVLLNGYAYGRLNGPKKMRSNKTSSSPSPVKSMQELSRGSSKGSYRPEGVELLVHTQCAHSVPYNKMRPES